MVVYVVVFLLFLVAAFGVGFILNMLSGGKSWASVVAGVVVAGYLVASMEGLSNKLVLSIPVVIGGVVASYTFRTLYANGFRLFGR